MEIKSKHSHTAQFLILLLLLPIGGLLFINYVIINVNKDNLFQYNLIVFLLLFLWMPTMFLYLISQVYKVIYVTNDRIVVKRLFGLSKQSYEFVDLKRTEYFYRGSYVSLLESTHGEQVTIAPKEYRNYIDLINAITPVVPVEQDIKLKAFTKGFKILATFGVILLLLNLFNLASI